MGRWPKAKYPREYNSYREMKRRVENEQRVLDQRFATFDDFMEQLGPRPTPAHSLHRKVIDGAYSPENVVWADKTEQANHRRNTRHLTYHGSKYPELTGQTLPLTEWARRTKQPPSRLHQRRTSGWSHTEIIDGERDKLAGKPFAKMTQEELVDFRPWRSGNPAKAEARYLDGRMQGEARLEFRARMIAEFATDKWQALYKLLREPDDANLRALRYSAQAREVLPRKAGVADNEWYAAYEKWESAERQLSEARAELAEWSAAILRLRRANSKQANREVLSRLREDDDELPDWSWLE